MSKITLCITKRLRMINNSINFPEIIFKFISALQHTIDERYDVKRDKFSKEEKQVCKDYNHIKY